MHIPSPLVKVFGQNTHKYLTAMNGLPLIGLFGNQGRSTGPDLTSSRDALCG